MKHVGKAIVCFLSLGFILNLVSCTKPSPTEIANGEKAIDSLIMEGQDSIRTNPKEALRLLTDAMSKTRDSLSYYRAKELCGTAYLWIGKADSAIAQERIVLAFLKTQPLSDKTKELWTSSCNLIANAHAQNANADSALVYYRMAQHHNMKKEKEPDILINIADQYKFKGDYGQAASTLRRALLLCDSLHLDKLKHPVNLGLGTIYQSLEDYKEADYYYSAAEKDYPNRNMHEKAIFSNLRGNYYYYTENYRKAEEWFNRGKQLSEKLGNEFLVNLCLLNLGDVSLHLGKLDVSEVYLNKAEPYFLSIQHKTALYYVNTIRIGLAVERKNYNEADLLKEKMEDSQPGIDPSIVSIRNKYLEQLYLAKGNYQKAYQYQSDNIKLNDSVRSDITRKRIGELDMRYKQDTLVLSQKIVIGKQKSEVKFLRLSTYLWIMVSISGLLLTILAYFIIQRKNNKLRLESQEQVTRFKMTNIQNRLSPHLLFNMLNHEMVDMDEKKKGRIQALAELLRRSLRLTEQISISLSDEVEFAKEYLALEQKRVLDDDFVQLWDIGDDIDMQTSKIIPMMIQIPVENAIKHGLQGMPGEKVLKIKIQKTPAGLHISIVNNGRVYRPNTHVSGKEGTGTGLRVISQMILILNMHNKEKASFSIRNIEDEVVVKIFIPQNYKFGYK